MSDPVTRRTFLASAAAAATFANPARPMETTKIRLGVIGTGSRGSEHARSFAGISDVTVAYTCDVDESRAKKTAEAVGKVKGVTADAKAVTDFRKILDDKEIDAITIATCNHWHAIIGILACKAGKHVYVEKPCSHNPREGELLVEAARKHKRHVQMGNQRRSYGDVGIIAVRARDTTADCRRGRRRRGRRWRTERRRLAIGHRRRRGHARFGMAHGAAGGGELPLP